MPRKHLGTLAKHFIEAGGGPQERGFLEDVFCLMYFVCSFLELVNRSIVNDFNVKHVIGPASLVPERCEWTSKRTIV